MKRFKYICLALAVFLTACGDSKTSSVTESAKIGDFVFNQPEDDVGQTGPSVGVDMDDSGNFATLAPSEDGSDPSTSDADPKGFESAFKDIGTSVSIQLGQNVYLSVPSESLVTLCTLPVFLETGRRARVLEEDTTTPEVLDASYSSGSLLHTTDTQLVLDSRHMLITARNQSSSIESAKKPTAELFNTGKLLWDAKDPSQGAIDYNSYPPAEQVYEEETDLYYKAIWEPETNEDFPIPENHFGRLMVIYDKTTGTLVTCRVSGGKSVKDDEDIDDSYTVDYIESSFRFSEVKPETLVDLRG